MLSFPTLVFFIESIAVFGVAVTAKREVISTPDAPKPLAPYSQAIRVDNTIYLAGQLGIDPVTQELVTGGVLNETEQALRNIGAVLRAAGANYGDVVQVTVYFIDLAHFQEVSKIYGRYFEKDQPARTGVQVAALPAMAMIEIEAVAHLDPQRDTTSGTGFCSTVTSVRVALMFASLAFYLRSKF